MGKKYIQGYPFVGHYDTWKLDLLQKMVEKNHGKLYSPGHKAVCEIRISEHVKLSREHRFLATRKVYQFYFFPWLARRSTVYSMS